VLFKPVLGQKMSLSDPDFDDDDIEDYSEDDGIGIEDIEDSDFMSMDEEEEDEGWIKRKKKNRPKRKEAKKAATRIRKGKASLYEESLSSEESTSLSDAVESEKECDFSRLLPVAGAKFSVAGPIKFVEDDDSDAFQPPKKKPSKRKKKKPTPGTLRVKPSIRCFTTKTQPGAIGKIEFEPLLGPEEMSGVFGPWIVDFLRPFSDPPEDLDEEPRFAKPWQITMLESAIKVFLGIDSCFTSYSILWWCEMGLGKTLTALVFSLMVSRLPLPERRFTLFTQTGEETQNYMVHGMENGDSNFLNNGKIPTDPARHNEMPINEITTHEYKCMTLVICDITVSQSWKQEINKSTRGLNVIDLVSSTEFSSGKELYKMLPDANIVIVNYDKISTVWSRIVKTLASEEMPALRHRGDKYKEGLNCLFKAAWRVIICDEAHTLRNDTTNRFKSVMALAAHCKIGMTGTPLQNKIADIRSLFALGGVRANFMVDYNTFQNAYTIWQTSEKEKQTGNFVRNMIHEIKEKSRYLENFGGTIDERGLLEKKQERKVISDLRTVFESIYYLFDVGNVPDIKRVFLNLCTKKLLKLCSEMMMDCTLHDISWDWNRSMDSVYNIYEIRNLCNKPFDDVIDTNKPVLPYQSSSQRPDHMIFNETQPVDKKHTEEDASMQLIKKNISMCEHFLKTSPPNASVEMQEFLKTYNQLKAQLNEKEEKLKKESKTKEERNEKIRKIFEPYWKKEAKILQEYRKICSLETGFKKHIEMTLKDKTKYTGGNYNSDILIEIAEYITAPQPVDLYSTILYIWWKGRINKEFYRLFRDASCNRVMDELHRIESGEDDAETNPIRLLINHHVVRFGKNTLRNAVLLKEVEEEKERLNKGDEYLTPEEMSRVLVRVENLTGAVNEIIESDFMSVEEYAIYQSVLQQSLEMLDVEAENSSVVKENRLNVFSLLMRLRQCVADARIIINSISMEDEIGEQEGLKTLNKLQRRILGKQKKVWADPDDESFWTEVVKSAHKVKQHTKIEMLKNVLRDKQKVADDDKVVVYTLFSSFIPYIVQAVEEVFGQGSCVNFHGKISAKVRESEIKRFRKDPSVRVLVPTLGCAATGLNLQFAGVIIHMEEWWNPGVKRQADARVNRMGQTKVVKIFSLVIKNTIEGKILEKQKEKAKIANEILGDGEKGFVLPAIESIRSVSSRVSVSEIKQLLVMASKESTYQNVFANEKVKLIRTVKERKQQGMVQYESDKQEKNPKRKRKETNGKQLNLVEWYKAHQSNGNANNKMDKNDVIPTLKKAKRSMDSSDKVTILPLKIRKSTDNTIQDECERRKLFRRLSELSRMYSDGEDSLNDDNSR